MGEKRLTIVHSVPIWLSQTECWLYDQVRFLPAMIESHVVCEATENLHQFLVPNIHSLTRAASWRNFCDKGLRRLRVRDHLGFLLKQAVVYHAELLHSHFGHVGWANREVPKKVPMKHVVSFYGFDVSYLPNADPRWNQRYRSLFDRADCILAQGPHMGRNLVRSGCPPEKVHVHYLGVAVDDIPFKPRAWSPGQPLRVLIAASFQEKKGIPYALEALGRLQREISLEITIIGDANNEARSQAEKQKILEVIAKRNLESRIRMFGYQPRHVLLSEAYKHQVFLSPSVTASDGDTEGGAPVTIIEMAASGMLVVSTTHGDIPDVIHHGRTGLLAPERDVEALVAHLSWLIKHEDGWLSMLKASRQHIQTEYNARKQAEKLGRIYERLIQS